MAEIFPPSWLVPGAQEMVVDFIRHMPLTPEDKKQILVEWAELAGVILTREKVERVTGLPAGEV